LELWAWISPVREGANFFRGNRTASAVYHVRHMWHCHVDVAYPWLSDWIRLQWVLYMKRASPISAARGSNALFSNDFGEDLLFCKTTLWKWLLKAVKTGMTVYRVFPAVGGHCEWLVGEFIVASAGRRHSQCVRSTEVFCAVDDRSQVVRHTSRLVWHRQTLGLGLTHTRGHVVDVTWCRCADTCTRHGQSQWSWQALHLTPYHLSRTDDWVNDQRPTWHKIHHFTVVVPGQSFG